MGATVSVNLGRVMSRRVVAISFLLLVGAVLRSLQYLAQTSLWLDEIMLSRNVLGRDLGRLLFEPLDYKQVAPAGFLALQKLAVSFVGGNEMGLRLVPWLSALGGLVLFWRLAARFVSGAPLLLSVGLFALSPTLTVHGGDAKQYAVDVTAVLAVVLLALRFREPPADRRRATIAAVAGGAAILVSQPAVLAGGALGAVLLLERRSLPSPRPPAAPFLLLVSGWGLCALASVGVAFATLAPATREYMRSFWAGGFFPAPWAGADAALWLPRTLGDVFGHFLFYVPEIALALTLAAGAMGVLAVLGVASRARARSWDMALLVAPILLALLASALRLYPVRDRVAIWMGPLLLVAAGVGLQAAARRLPERVRPALIGIACALLLAPDLGILLLEPPPYRSPDIRPVLEQVAAQRREGDAV